MPYVISTRSSTYFVKSILPQNTMGWYQLKKNQTNILSTFSRHQFLLIFQYCCTISTILPMCLRRLPISYTKKKNPNFLPGCNVEVYLLKLIFSMHPVKPTLPGSFPIALHFIKSHVVMVNIN